MCTRQILHTALVFLLACLCMIGCGSTRQSMDIDYNDERLNDGLESSLHQGKSGLLRDFTSWEWDEVHLFGEHTDRAFIEDAVGAPVIKGDFYDSKASLLVFEDAGQPVKAIGVSGDYLRGADNRVSWPSEVLLEPRGSGFLVLTLPGGG